MNKKGFTLVELLAVIAILAILVIIALPNVIEMFNNAKKNSFETEVKNVLKQATTTYMSDQISGETAGKVYSTGGNELSLEGKSLTYSIIVDSTGTIKSATIYDNTFCYSGPYGSETAIDYSDLSKGLIENQKAIQTKGSSAAIVTNSETSTGSCGTNNYK